MADAPARDDLFTLIHKGLRSRLFAVTSSAGTLDWEDPTEVAAFAADWRELRHLLEIDAAHEDEHFFPLLREAAPDLLAAVDAGHDEQDRALTKVAAVVADAVASPSAAVGLGVHRELSAFVAGYLLHLLDEECTVMPAIWEHCSDDDLARTRAAFMAAMGPDDAALSRRVMLPALAPGERAAIVRTVRAAAPAPVFDALVADVRQVLSDAQWTRLATDVGLG